MRRPETTRVVAPHRHGGAPHAPARSFASTLALVVPPVRAQAAAPSDHEPLAPLPYAVECAAKRDGLQRYWRAHRLPGLPEPLIASPRPRGYRTSSKRRVAIRNGTVHLFLGDRPPVREIAPFVASPLEPAEHTEIYGALRTTLNEPVFRLLAAHLHYLIIRGSYAERAVVLNVDALSGPLVRKIKMLAEQVRSLPLSALFVYLDPTRSNYHFESRRPDDAITFKRIFGPDQLTASIAGCRYRYHPTSFSQVNESIVPELLAHARALLVPQADEPLLDLYCGYGLFSHALAPAYARVLGVDADGPAIRAAAANTSLNPCGVPRRFLAARIDRALVDRGLRRQDREAILLDPPRHGPQPGVIAALAQRRPGKVLHVFCDVDQMPAALADWQAAGYHVRRVVPLDMFPGAANLEVLVLLAPAAAGRTGRRG
jgi:tRNA/tmRNA/rRNA uracil-C5-methylase (TrmA/RlmC/RlmD family)